MSIQEYLNQLNEELSDNIPKDIQKLYDEMNGAEMVDFNPSAYKTITRKDWSTTNSGTCWDFVNYEDCKFSKMPYNYETYYMEIDNEKDCPCHTFLLYEYDGQWYWFEVSWLNHQGIHEFDTKEDALKEITDLHNNEFNDGNYPLYIYKYNAKDFDNEYKPIEFISRMHDVGNEITLTESDRHLSNVDYLNWDRVDISDETKQFCDNFKYYAYPVYHKGTKFYDGESWFATDSDSTKGTSEGRLGTYAIGFNNPYTYDCKYFDYDSIPMDTKTLKFFNLYKDEFGNKYDHIPDESQSYDDNDCIKQELKNSIYTITSDDFVKKIFEKGYDCAILENINELQIHYPTDNTDYVVRHLNQLRKLEYDETYFYFDKED